jgi:hypothetical protein
MDHLPTEDLESDEPSNTTLVELNVTSMFGPGYMAMLTIRQGHTTMILSKDWSNQ